MKDSKKSCVGSIKEACVVFGNTEMAESIINGTKA